MPREPSDARAALMTVYMSQRSSFLTLSDTPKGGKLKAAERPPSYRIYAKNSTTTKMLVKSAKKSPHRRRRSDAEECMHGIRTNLGRPGLGLGRIGRTIYGVGESNRANRRQRCNGSSGLPGFPNSPALKRSQGGLTAQQLAVIEVGMEIARREAESRHVLAKKGMGEIGTLASTRGDGREGPVCVKEEMEDMAHADKYFDMYINAERCG
jgi:hypothetical protein